MARRGMSFEWAWRYHYGAGEVQWGSGTRTYLQTLLYFLDKHVSVCCKAIHGENSTIGPVGE